jgi:Bacterial SH3 domain
MGSRPVRSAILTLLLSSAAAGFGAEAQSLDANGLAALQSAVHEMCVQPDHRGAYLQLDGDLDAGATLKVAGVSGQGNITKQDWEGVSQRLDQYKTDPRACAVSIVAILAPLMKPPASAPPPAVADRYSFPINLDPNGDNWLALRSEPALRGYRMMKMGPQTLFTVFEVQGDWAHIRLRTGETGWAAKAYIGCCKVAP